VGSKSQSKRAIPHRARRSCTREELTAYHEAGHAVISFGRRIGISVVTIAPTERYLGRIEHTQVPSYEPVPLSHGMTWDERIAADKQEMRRQSFQKARVFREIDVLLAGVLAVVRLTGQLPKRSDNYATYPDFQSAHDWAEFICASERQSEALIEWRKVVVEEDMKQPATWSCVRAVAKQLLSKKTLNGREVRKVIRAQLERLYQADLRRRYGPNGPPWQR